jgi:2,3-bisphosphoglycerate-dependent phosphoglycerate mutase
MTVFYLVRHAHAVWAPDEGQSLSPQGWGAARRLEALLCPFPITGVYASPYLRARQTVELLARCLDLPISVLPALRERKLSAGRQRDFFAAVQWAWEHPNRAHPGGESNVDAQRRGVEAVHRLRRQLPGEHLVLVTHGNLLALILQGFSSGVDYAFWRRLSTPDVYALRWERHEAHFERLWPGSPKKKKDG